MSQTDPIYCGAKKYTSDLSWLSIYKPTNVLTESFELRVATSDYNFSGTHTVSLVVGFEDTNYT